MEKKKAIARYASLGWKFKDVNPAKYLRVNTLHPNNALSKSADSSVVNTLIAKAVKLSKVPYLQQGYEITSSRFSLGSTVEYLSGQYYLQGAAAQIPVEILDPRPGETVLDCCASPGGKLTQMAALMENKGVIVAFEKKPERLKRMANNIERMRASNIVAYHKDARNVHELPIKFDKILVDAPCSGNFTQEKSWFKKRNIADFEKMSKLQREILKSALKALKPNGTLVYSTCSLEPEENELVIDYAIKYLNVELLDMTISIAKDSPTTVLNQELHPDIKKCKRVWPAKTEGFFIAKMRLKQ